MDIKAAGDNSLYVVSAQDILLVLVRGIDDILRKFKLPILLVSGPKRNIFRQQLKQVSKQVSQRTGCPSIFDHYVIR